MLSEAFKDADPATPIYFILSAGANITADVDKLADKHHKERGATYHDISLGQVTESPPREAALSLAAAFRRGRSFTIRPAANLDVHGMPPLQSRFALLSSLSPKFGLSLSDECFFRSLFVNPST